MSLHIKPGDRVRVQLGDDVTFLGTVTSIIDKAHFHLMVEVLDDGSELAIFRNEAIVIPEEEYQQALLQRELTH